MTSNIRAAAGELLVVGLGGAELTGLERAWLKLVRPAGVILFRRNVLDVGQARGVLREAAGLCAENPLRCVDVEGGTVDRLRDALAPLPSAQAVGRAMRTPTHRDRAAMNGAQGVDRVSERRRAGPSTALRSAQDDKCVGKSNFAREHGELVGLGVRAFGFNATLAPVLDLGLEQSAGVMGTRAAAGTAEGVVRYGRGFLAGLKAQGVAGCGKHFPGLGGGTLDSHLETPEIGRTMRELNGEDLVPFGELRDELPMVMVNHAAYPLTQGGVRPASVSKYWITGVLRGRIGYRGLIFSDDLEMGGILKCMPIEEAVVEAVRAGMDLMEICHSPELILRAYEALISESERSLVFRKLLLARARECGLKRKKLFAGKEARALSAGQFEGLRRRILEFGERVALAQEMGAA